MAADTYTIRVSMCRVDEQVVVVVDGEGREHGRVTVPVGFEVRVVPAPWWRRLTAWLRLRWWRAGVAWGA